MAPTTITNAAGASQTFTYDQNILQPTSSTDENGVTTNYFYVDALDRITTVKHAVGTSAETWTQYNYPAPAGGVLPDPLDVKMYQDQSSAGDGALRTDTIYGDGFGRVTATNQYEGSGVGAAIIPIALVTLRSIPAMLMTVWGE